MYCISSSCILCLEAKRGGGVGVGGDEGDRKQGGGWLKAAVEKEGQRFEIKGSAT